MTGVWMTMAPDQVDQLIDEARSFANEFAPALSGVESPDREQIVAQAGENGATSPPDETRRS